MGMWKYKLPDHFDMLPLRYRVQVWELPKGTGQGLDVPDKRPKGGSFWVVGGLELDQIMKEVSKKGYQFSYTANGGKTTRNHAAWFCNKKESELA